MKVWVIRNKKREFLWFRYVPYYEIRCAGPNEVRGHYERTDTWPSDIDYDMQSHEWVPDEPPIPEGTWYVRFSNEKIDYGTKLNPKLVPDIRRKIMTYKSQPIILEI